MSRSLRPCRVGPAVAALALSLGASLTAAGTANAAPLVTAPAAGTQPASDPDISPAGCAISYVANPHDADSVSGALKVNAKSECNKPVQELDLSVTLFGDNMRTLKETKTKEANKKYIFNQGTYIICKNRTDIHTFQGAAMGTSWENGKPYVQFKFGPRVQARCGY